MSIELIRITDSPSDPPTGTAFGGVLVLHIESPRSSTSITVRLNRGVEACAAGPANDRQAPKQDGGAWSRADDAKELLFDLTSSPAHTVKAQHQRYKITLMQIGSEKGFPWYEFQVTTLQ